MALVLGNTDSGLYLNFFRQSRLVKQAMRGMNGTFLVLDDTESIAALVQNVLKFRGYSSKVAGTIEDGRNIIKETGPDLIACAIVDVMLPDGNGIDFVEWLHKNHAQIPSFIYTSAEIPPIKKELERRSLMTEVVHKNGHINDLFNALGIN